MTRDDIIRMAREAGFNEFSDGLRDDGTRDTYLDCWPEQLERFANLISAAEREACAEVCEGRIGGAVQTNEWWSGFRAAMQSCAAAIRARSNT